MSLDKSFVDTNVLVYAYNLEAGPKHERARELIQELWATQNGIISTQVLQEFYSSLRRLDRSLKISFVRELVGNYFDWQVVVNTPESIFHASEIEERYQVSFWDALIIHAAEISGASVLYSEDLSDGQRYGAVRVMNPFLAR
jgi:predicted nucleic acid-binding protein